MKKLISAMFCSVLFIISGCCEHKRSEAKELVKDQKKCSAGDTCVIVHYDDFMEYNCLGAFQCFSSLNEKNLSEFKSEARDLGNSYDHCSICEVAGCPNPDGIEPFCDEEASMCDWR